MIGRHLSIRMLVAVVGLLNFPGKLYSQSIVSFFASCFNLDSSTTINKFGKYIRLDSVFRDYHDKAIFYRSFKLSCDSLKTIYDRKVHKILISTTETDLIASIDIYIKFDALLYQAIRADLGKPNLMYGTGEEIADDSENDKSFYSWTYNERFRLLLQIERYGVYLGGAMDDWVIFSIIPLRAKKVLFVPEIISSPPKGYKSF